MTKRWLTEDDVNRQIMLKKNNWKDPYLKRESKVKTYFPITPVAKPRMTQRDKWAKRPAVQKYWEYKDKVREYKITLPDNGYHIIFTLPMPMSWSDKKKSKMNGKPHQVRPDKDNLEKGLLDAIFEEDSHIWDGRVTKLWGYVGSIEIMEE